VENLMAAFDERFLDVNAHGVLRIPLELWLAGLVLARGWIVAMFTIASLLSNQKDVVRLLGGDIIWVNMLFGFPALVVLWVFAHRTPDASPRVRWLWPHTRTLLFATAWGNFAYLLWFLWQSRYWAPWPELFMASFFLIDLAICWGIYSSEYLRQVLREFPAAKDKTHARTPRSLQ
jgi:hypothetical protein